MNLRPTKILFLPLHGDGGRATGDRDPFSAPVASFLTALSLSLLLPGCLEPTAGFLAHQPRAAAGDETISHTSGPVTITKKQEQGDPGAIRHLIWAQVLLGCIALVFIGWVAFLVRRYRYTNEKPKWLNLCRKNGLRPKLD